MNYWTTNFIASMNSNALENRWHANSEL